jgi:hypothetical protein
VEQTIEVRYVGVVVGRSNDVRDAGAGSLFVGIGEPMPIGTAITLKVGDRLVEAKVEVVSESQDASRAGMQVSLSNPKLTSLFQAGASVAAARQPSAAAPPPPERPPEAAVAEAPHAAESLAAAEESASHHGDDGDSGGDDRLPAPDPSAFGGHPGGKRGRRGKRR